MILASVSSLTGPSREFTRDSYRTGDSGLGAGAAQSKGTVRKNWVGADSARLADCTMRAQVVHKQILRTRACRARAQDDNAARGFRKER